MLVWSVGYISIVDVVIERLASNSALRTHNIFHLFDVPLYFSGLLLIFLYHKSTQLFRRTFCNQVFHNASQKVILLKVNVL